MQFDSIHGKLPLEIKKTSKGLKYKNKEIKFFSEKEPSNLPWKVEASCERRNYGKTLVIMKEHPI